MRWLRLRTFDDPELKALEKTIEAWWHRYINNEQPCWLTLCGKSESGKTHCADRIWQESGRRGLRSVSLEQTLYIPQKLWWPEFVNALRAGKAYEKLADTKHWPLLYLDEIGASRDSTGFVADQLYTILGQRDRKWTILTTNLTFEQLGKIDERIGSRCVRNNGIVVTLYCEPYSARRLT